MRDHVLTGFGFGPIQAGLFLKEAFDSGRFRRLVVAEVDAALIDALRANGNRYALNIAHADRVETVTVEGVELLNPGVEADRLRLEGALGESTEVVTALPSVAFFERGAVSVAQLLAAGLSRGGPAATLVYAAENHNHAAEILERAVSAAGRPAGRPVQYLNTVIGKMSQVVTDAGEIRRRGLAPVAPSLPRAFLVEAFNHILVTRNRLPSATPGIPVFDEKDDLLPFEEAKLYGHNAIHAWLAYLGAARGYTRMPELKRDGELMADARRAFLDESGAALTRKYASLHDPLFSPDGYRRYADDLLDRMTNPFLADAVERAARDPARKLGLHDRLFGAMLLALEQGIQPEFMARGAAAAVKYMLATDARSGVPEPLRRAPTDGAQMAALLAWVWRGETHALADQMVDLVWRAALALP